MDPNELQLRNDERTILLEGADVLDVLPNLFPLLNGSFKVDEIIQKLSYINKDKIMNALDILNKYKVLEDANTTSSTDISKREMIRYNLQLNLFSHFSQNKYKSQEILKRSRVGILGLDEMGSELAQMLTLVGIGTIVGIDSKKVTKSHTIGSKVFSELDTGSLLADVVKNTCERINPYVKFETRIQSSKSSKDIISIIRGLDLIVVCNNELKSTVFELVNESSLKLRVKWTSCASYGLKGFIGPTIVPYETGCYKCFELRSNSNLQFYREFLAFQEHIKSTGIYKEYGKLPMFIGIVCNLMSMEIIKLLTNFLNPTTLGRQMIINFVEMNTEFHTILKLPRCPSCGLQSKNVPVVRPWI